MKRNPISSQYEAGAEKCRAPLFGLNYTIASPDWNYGTLRGPDSSVSVEPVSQVFESQLMDGSIEMRCRNVSA